MQMNMLIAHHGRMQQWWSSLDNVKQLYVAGMIMAGGLLGLPFFVIGMLAKHSLARDKPKDFDMLLSFARVAGLIGIAAAAGQLISPPTRLNEGLETAARYSAFFLDMVPDGTCAPIEGDRVARINDSLVIVGRMTEDGLQFVRKDCALAADAAALKPPRKLGITLTKESAGAMR